MAHDLAAKLIGNIIDAIQQRIETINAKMSIIPYASTDELVALIGERKSLLDELTDWELKERELTNK